MALQNNNYVLRRFDFFPPFERDFQFTICRTQEEFVGGRRQIIISKDFCNLLVNNGIIKYDSNNLIPIKRIDGPKG
ncbi:hypothetical protein [Flagellimonas sp. CMM7]|uniref:hypothetical protein n=1 Tax=Flagellimonas sp. CMM7 TaxID=2654676 RepID=UPI0013D0EEBC|nr:hypothetical protein [Flagellimonas sp. CMM7]UII79688.1 hypothetical protein LV704_18755 [Flagellimonas sp. CMM7]